MSNKLIKENKEKDSTKETSVKAIYGRILLGCGIAFWLLILVIWQFPTNLDGDPLKLIITAGFVLLGLLLCVVGIYWMVKKPKTKLGKYMAKCMAKELGIEDPEMIEAMKDFEV